MAKLSCQRCRSQVNTLPISRVFLCVRMFPASLTCLSQLVLGMQAVTGSWRGASGHLVGAMRMGWPGVVLLVRMGVRHCLWAPGTAA